MRTVRTGPRSTPIPPRMRVLPRDPRGYPIPWLVQRNDAGKPFFAVNDEERRQRCFARDLCGICGKPLSRVRWFVGGPAAALHERGAYLDPPMHGECARYALRVCPYLALASYRRLDPERLAEKLDQPLLVNTTYPGRPELFCAVRCMGTTIVTHHRGTPFIETVAPYRPYLRIDYWQNGGLLARRLGERLAAEYMEKFARDMPQPEERRIALP